MGATNRPQDVDKAILRRMPAMFQIGLPTNDKRKDIIQLILRRELLADGVDFDIISQQTEGFSGSDLRELCRVAAMFRVRELGPRLNSGAALSGLRPITMNDFLNGIKKMKESKVLSSGKFHLEPEGLD